MRTLHPRRGFTLIELIVAMGIIIVLLSLAVVLSNSATMDSYKIVGAGDRLSQALITAKSRAARDKAPRGIRLLAGNDGYLRELIYIEQPDAWVPDQSFTFPTSIVNSLRSQLVLKYPQAGTSPNYPKPTPATCQVFLLLTPTDFGRMPMTPLPSPPNPANTYGFGGVALASSPDISAAFAFSTATEVSGVLQYAPAGMRVLQLNVTSIINPDLAAGQTPTTTNTRGTFQTTQFGIYPPAMPLAGEPTVILSRNAAVDPLASSPQSVPGQNIDILFAPDGHVVFRSEGVIALLVRDTSKYTPPAGLTVVSDAATYRGAGEMLLVAVIPKTGTVATKPVNEPDGTPTSDPYKFAKDAIRGGL